MGLVFGKKEGAGGIASSWVVVVVVVVVVGAAAGAGCFGICVNLLVQPAHIQAQVLAPLTNLTSAPGEAPPVQHVEKHKTSLTPVQGKGAHWNVLVDCLKTSESKINIPPFDHPLKTQAHFGSMQTCSLVCALDRGCEQL